MAAAIGVGLPVEQPSGSMIIDIGGGTSEIAVIALNGIVNDTSIRVAGDELSEAIIMYLKKNYNLGNSKILWLSNVEHEYAVNPVNLGNIYHIIEQFLKAQENPVLLISGMEYLISQNSYQAILKLIQLLNDQVAVNQAVLIIPVAVDVLEDKHLSMLERELTSIE